MKWVETQGKRPRTGEKLLHVRFRNGLESRKPYRADQMRFTQVGDDWDVIAVARADEPVAPSGAAWTPVSGGY